MQAEDPAHDAGRERRSYLRTIDAPPPSEAEREHASLGRIAIKRVHVASTVDEAPSPTGASLHEATRAIRRSQDRDRVADLVCETLVRFMPACEAALILVIRGTAAISWKGFSRSGAALAEVAVPIDQPGVVPSVVHTCQTLRGSTGELGPIDQLLMVSLGATSGDLLVVPVSIGGQVMCVIAMATRPGAPATIGDAIGAATGAAFARLMRNASR
jgi:hypothetical protein